MCDIKGEKSTLLLLTTMTMMVMVRSGNYFFRTALICVVSVGITRRGLKKGTFWRSSRSPAHLNSYCLYTFSFYVFFLLGMLLQSAER